MHCRQLGFGFEIGGVQCFSNTIGTVSRGTTNFTNKFASYVGFPYKNYADLFTLEMTDVFIKYDLCISYYLSPFIIYTFKMIH